MDQSVKVLYSASYGGAFDGDRHNPSLIESVENGNTELVRRTKSQVRPPPMNLGVETVPPYYDYYIHEYDGLETVIICYPYRKLAWSLYNNNDKYGLIQAIKDGKLRPPNDRESRQN